MSRPITVLIVCVLLIGAFFTFRQAPPSLISDSKIEPQIASSKIEENAPFHKWREFTSPTGHFKVLLPGLPQHITDKIPDANTKEPRKYDTFVTADEAGPALMISVITFPKPIEIEAVEDTLKSIVNDMLNRNKNNNLKDMSIGVFRDYKSLDFSLTNGDLLIVGKVFANDDTLYVLSMINQNGAFDKKELDFFENSFEIIGSPKKNQP